MSSAPFALGQGAPTLSGARVAAVAGTLVALAILLVYRGTALDMAQIWRRSETFSHCLFILPISLWLVWRKRAELAGIPARPFWPGLLFVAGAGFLWLLGVLADAAVVEQFALVLLLQSATLTVCGVTLTRAVLFPLAFLLFAVPFGDAFVPKLMDWTADATIRGLELTGLPVYREGNNFVIPSGKWSVVEACSGIRYLIASVMAGTLYAYLMYRSPWKRFAFAAASVLVPILANWMRAYLIVMLGHLSGNELAAGVDHLIYGWIFFGIVLFAMFWIGARYRDGDAAVSAGATLPGSTALFGGLAATAVLAVAVAAVWTPIAAALLRGDADTPVSLAPVAGRNGWEPVEAMSPGLWRPLFSGYRADRIQMFERKGERVVVALLYYAAQSQGRELVNSENVLVTTKDPNWHPVASGQTQLPPGMTPVYVRTARLERHGESFNVAWWYWADDRATTSDVVAKLLLAWSRLRLRGDDSAAVFLYTEPSERSDGDQLLLRFASDMGGPIDAALAATKGGRR